MSSSRYKQLEDSDTTVLSGVALSGLAMAVPTILMVSRCQISRFQSPQFEVIVWYPKKLTSDLKQLKFKKKEKMSLHYDTLQIFRSAKFDTNLCKRKARSGTQCKQKLQKKPFRSGMQSENDTILFKPIGVYLFW